MKLGSHIGRTVVVLLVAALCLGAQVAAADRSRADFTKSMAKIHENMAETEVLAILGKPDDIRTKQDPGGIIRAHTKEIWCYGSKGHLSFATLGCVFINEDGRTQESFGGKGQPPRSGLFTEEQLQDLLRLLDDAPPIQGYSFNPLPIIQIVNALQPLGQERSLAAIREYLRVSDDFSQFIGAGYGLFPVLLVLFDLPDEFPPSTFAHLGMPDPSGPKDLRLFPRFPIALIDDVPLLLINGYSLQGRATSMEEIVKVFEAHGRFRSQPLMPRNDPLAVLLVLTSSKQWVFADSTLRQSGSKSFGDVEDNQRERSMLMEQLLRLIDSVYRLRTDVFGNRLPCGEPPDPAWQKIAAEVTALSIHWDPQLQLYVFQDGTHLPISKPKIYQRVIWPLEGMGYKEADFTLERKSENWVEVMVARTLQRGATLKPGTLIVFTADDAQTPLETFNFTETKGNGSGSSESRSLRLREGTVVKARLTVDGGQTNWSLIMKP